MSELTGLEDAGEIVGLVTTEQLEEIFDKDVHLFKIGFKLKKRS